MKSILVTGGAGFIGANYVPYFLRKYEDFYIINLDKLTYAGDLSNLKEIENHICEILDNERPRTDGKSIKKLISFIKDRTGHDRRYAIDASKIENELNWKADENFESGILKTIKSYIYKEDEFSK